MATTLADARPSSRLDLARWYRGLLDEQKRSGLSVAEFADEIGVTAATLYNWRRRLQASPRRSPRVGAGLVRVQVKGNAQPPGEQLASLIIRIGYGRSIEVPRGFDAGELARVVEVLESC